MGKLWLRIAAEETHLQRAEAIVGETATPGLDYSAIPDAAHLLEIEITLAQTIVFQDGRMPILFYYAQCSLQSIGSAEAVSLNGVKILDRLSL